LVELMIVILVLGILVGIAVPVFISSRDEAQSKTCKSNLRNIITTSNIYAANNDSTFPDGMDDLVPRFFQDAPTCPETGPYDQAPNSIDWHGGESSPEPTCSQHGTLAE